MTPITFAIPGFSLDSFSSEGRMVRSCLADTARVVGRMSMNPGTVVFHVGDAFNPQNSDTRNAKVLERLLDCLITLDGIWLAKRPLTPGLYDSGVQYNRTLVWDTTPALYARQMGDCKSLASARVAELRRAGVWCRPVFRHKDRSDGNFRMYHILIMFQDGTWECPSARLGMHDFQEDPRFDRESRLERIPHVAGRFGCWR